MLDRDIDRLMGPRTASRPVAAGRITPARATAFGIALSSLSFVILAVFANLLSAVLALSGGAFYVLVYTVWLKRSTSQNIVIGGAAGAIPPLAGWAAAHGSLGLGAAYLFAIVLLWTPPHFWALALLLAPHYETAKVPMLPVIRGTDATTRHVLAYTLALTVATLVPGLLGPFGLLYEVSAVAARRRLLRARLAAVASQHGRPRGRALSLLAAVPRAALPRGRGRRGGRLSQRIEASSQRGAGVR